MKGFDQLHIKSGVKSRSKIDLSFTHLTTMNFGQVTPLLAKEMFPGDEFPISCEAFSRTAPLVKPTYGKVSFHSMWAFVPYFQVADDYEAWRIGKKVWEGNVPNSRYIPFTEYVYFLIAVGTKITPEVNEYDDNEGHLTNQQGQILRSYDWTFVNSQGTQVYYHFQDESAKVILRVLFGLGYSLPSNVNLQSTSAWYQYYSTRKLSAMPLLAFFKAFNDWMSQSQRFNSSAVTQLLNNIRHGVVGPNITSANLSNLFAGLRVCYDNDYFTSAWQKPNAPLNDAEVIDSMNVPEQSADVIQNTRSDVSLITPVADNSVALHNRSLQFLKGFADYVRRRNYSGSRAVQQVFSEFGIKTEDYRSNYSHVLKTSVHGVQVGDVTSTAQTDDADLGDYAGKAIMDAPEQVMYKAHDFGMLFHVGWFTCAPMNPYGFDRQTLRVDPLDYYNSEFDGIGADAISFAELFTNPITKDSTQDFSVFGFTERYNSYRFSRDVISGDFRNLHKDSEMNVWHTARLLNDVRHGGTMVAQSQNMNTLSPTDSEYNRIFAYTDGDFDHFYLTVRYKIPAIRPIKSLNEVPGLGVGDTIISRNGNEIS